MTITNIYTGVETPDAAALTAGGVQFRCLVWRNTALDRIDAKIFAEGEDGQMTLISQATLGTAVTGHITDVPRVLAVGTLFVVHWIDHTVAPAASVIERSLFDVTDFATGWANQGNVALHLTNQYDHSIVYNSTPEEFVVSRRTAAGDILTARYQSPFAWVDTVHTNTDAGLTIADTVLSVHSDEDADATIVAYQDTLTLQAFRRNASDGLTLGGPNEVFADLGPAGDSHFTAVSITCTSVTDFIVVAEFIDDTNEGVGGYRANARGFAWRMIRGTTAAGLHESQWQYGYNLASQAWKWASGTTGEVDVYVGVAFKSLTDGQEYEQNFVYVVRLDIEALAGANAAGVVRPITCTAIMTGDFDARGHGFSPVASPMTSPIGSRLNHLPSPSGPGRSSPAATEGYALGPDGKSMFFPILRWTRLVATSDNSNPELQPIQSGVGFVRFYHEDPTAIRRADLEATQPDTPQWVGAAQRVMSRAVEIPTGLALTGGVLVLYDGVQPVEQGYPHAPEISEINASAGGGGFIDVAGDYHFIVTYSWTDNLGQLHRSPPSTPVTLTMAVNDLATLQVRPVGLTAKDDSRRFPLAGPVTIEVWRTLILSAIPVVNSQTGFFLFRREYAEDGTNFQLQDTPINDASDIRQAIIAGRSNLFLENAELYYQQLNLQTLLFTPPNPTPHTPLTAATVWRNRLIGIDPADPRIVKYSEPILPFGRQAKAPEFLDTNTVRFDGRGEVTMLRAMDYTVVVGTRDAIYTVEGEPSTGGSVSSLDIRNVVDGTGCIAPDSVVHTHEGVYFQAAKGMMLLDRGFNMQYIGAPVEELLQRAGVIRGGVHLQKTHQVRWVFNELPGTGPLEVRPRILTYDYSTGLWSVDELIALAQALTSSRLNEQQGCVAWRGRQGDQQLVVLQQGGLGIERAQSDTVYSDEGAFATLSIGVDVQTEWIMLSGVAGLYRVREIGIQTERQNAGAMTVDIYYDTDGTFDETTPDDTFAFASPAPDYLPIRPRIQKLRAFMLRIRESAPPATENVRIIAMMVRWQPKNTPGRYARSSIGV